ncbi:MAG TPA: hypothetical protein VJ718_06210, partial [Candidatus Binataceae bacterium]|nr:hypothetical protein [Candidatus Binataceae bacterium]
MKLTDSSKILAQSSRRFPGLALIAVVASIAVAFSGCGLLHRKSADNAKAAATPQNDSSTPAPQAKIRVSYARPDDFITLLVVTKYYGADTLMTTPGKDGTASIIRFQGGAVVWEFGVSKGLLMGVPVIGAHEDRPYQVATVEYSVVPKGFTQQTPESGPPEPLEPGHYYVFAVTRASGSVSYEAVKVNGDGSLEAYAAEPRAGASYKLCC